MKKVLTILSVAIMVLATSCKDESQGEIKLVTPEEMQTLLEQKDVQLLKRSVLFCFVSNNHPKTKQ